jgi:hypothetical protein
VELYPLTIQLLLYPERVAPHTIDDLLEASFVEVGKLWLVTLEKLDIRILHKLDIAESSVGNPILKSRIGIVKIPANLSQGTGYIE